MMRISLITISLCFALPLGEINADPNSLTDYVSLYNSQSKPKNYQPEHNAAEHYQKAISLFIEAPEEIRNGDIKSWPAELSYEETQILRQWVKQNGPALAHLRAGIGKPYLWTERTSNGLVLGIKIPELATMRNLMYLLCYKAKLAAIEGNFNTAAEDITAVYQIGEHYTAPLTMVEQAVGTGFKSYAIETALTIMGKVKTTKKDRELLFDSLKKHIKEENYQPDIMVLRLIALDCLQRMYVLNKEGRRILSETEARRQLAMLNLHAQGLVMLSGTFAGEHYKSDFTGISYQQAEELLLSGLDDLKKVTTLDACQINEMINSENSALQKIQQSHPLLNTLALTAVNMKLALYERLRAQISGLNIIMAVLEFQENTGSLPVNLGDLQNAGLLQKIPVDPFSDRPMKYKRLSADFTVYSYGVDFNDNGGRSRAFDEFMLIEQNGDIVMWPIKK